MAKKEQKECACGWEVPEIYRRLEDPPILQLVVLECPVCNVPIPNIRVRNDLE